MVVTYYVQCLLSYLLHFSLFTVLVYSVQFSAVLSKVGSEEEALLEFLWSWRMIKPKVEMASWQRRGKARTGIC